MSSDLYDGLSGAVKMQIRMPATQADPLLLQVYKIIEYTVDQNIILSSDLPRLLFLNCITSN